MYSAPFTVSGEGDHTIDYWSVDDAGVYETPKILAFTIRNPFTDLSVNSSDITFNPTLPDPNQSFTINALIRNLGVSDANSVEVSFYEFDTLLGQTTIASLPAGGTAQASIQATFADEGFRLISVKVDEADLITESNEDNNEAGQVLQVGQPNVDNAVMVISASSPTTCHGDSIAISGQAYYDFADVPGTQDYPVKGGSVSVIIFEPATNNPLGVFTGSHTDVSGNYSQGIIVPAADGTYPVTVEVTDRTITWEIQTTLTVSGACPTPPPVPPPPPPSGDPGGTPPPNSDPGTPPDSVRDIYLYSEDIHFSDSNPDPGEAMNIYAYIHYFGTTPVYNVPVTVQYIFPVDGVLRTITIGSTTISFPNGGASSPVVVSMPWTNTAEGAHVIQVVTQPSFTQYTGNDKATRLIVVGNPPLLQLTKSVALLVDADGSGTFSPGDTVAYSIDYQNTGTNDVTGAAIFDDFDETLLGTPSQISNGGVLAENITWNMGTLVAGSSGTLTYQAVINSAATFPTGQTPIKNTAILVTDQTAPVAATAEFDVAVNAPPTVNAGPDQTVDEGTTVSLSASGNDFEDGQLTYDWDLDNDGTFETSGQNVTFLADDGPNTYPVTVRVTDSGGLTASDTLVINVNNVAPTATFAASAGPIGEGQNVTLSFSQQYDPSGADTVADFTYAFDCENDGTFEVTGDMTGAYVCTYLDNGTYTAFGRIQDKDGDYTDYTTAVTVVNLPPQVGPITAPDTPMLINTSISVSAVFTDPGVLDTHTAVWDWGDGTTSSGTVSETSGSGTVTDNHLYAETGVYTIKLMVTDNDGDSGEAIYEFIVIYDPSGGFVTGGGWIMSQAGWCQLNTVCANAQGKAHFGFVSKYQQGNNVPTGNTGFKFQAGNFDFESDSYEWLVVNMGGTNAQFKGSGTINGNLAPNGTEFKFMIWARDMDPGGDDTFRIRIWYEDNGVEIVVYDNGFDQPIGGGNIRVQD